MIRIFTALAVAGLAAGAANAQVDGSILGDGYGAPYALQTVETGFGDANPNNGSELNGAYARISGGRFYLALTGNLESNFNKLEIFLQTGTGGSNVYSSAGNDNTGNMNGMTFSGGFAPNFHVIGRRGSFNGDRFDLDFTNLANSTFSSYGNVFGGTNVGSGVTGTGINAQPIEVGYNNSNVAGVVGGSGPANQAAAAAVTTGFEISFSLADLGLMGLDGETICVMAFVNNGDHNYASNQFLPGLTAPQGNLGGDGVGGFNGSLSQINLNNFQQQGYFIVPVPAPGALAVLGLGGLALARRRR